MASIQIVWTSPEALHITKEHSHKCWEIILNLTGTGTEWLGKEAYAFFPGSVSCIPPNMPHYKEADGTFTDICIQATEFTPLRGPELIRTGDDEEHNVQKLMEVAYSLFRQNTEHSLAIVGMLYDSLQYVIMELVQKKKLSPVTEQLKNDIIHHFNNPEFSIAETMRSYSYNEDYIRRRFKKELGLTPTKYMNSLRIDLARQLISQKDGTGHSISEIAFYCGFYDQHYFSRVFKQFCGMTPEEYYEHARQQSQETRKDEETSDRKTNRFGIL